MAFDKVETAQRMREVIKTLGAQEARKQAPPPLVARMISVDVTTLQGKAWVPGDPEPVTVKLLPAAIPVEWQDRTFFVTDADDNEIVPDSVRGWGAMVILETLNGELYVTRILTEGQFAVNGQNYGITMVQEFSDTTSQNYLDRKVVGYPFERFHNFQCEQFGMQEGQAIVFGPFTHGGPFGELGRIELTVQKTNYDIFNSCKFYDFVFSQSVAISHGLTPKGTMTTHFLNRWFRLLPQHSMCGDGSIMGDGLGDFDLDFQWTITKWGSPPAQYAEAGEIPNWEIWFRVVKRHASPADDIDKFDFAIRQTDVFKYMRSIDEKQRIIHWLDASPPGIKGYWGFHNSYHIFNDADFSGVKDYYSGHQWANGPWRGGELRAAQALQQTWTHDGIFTWNGTRLKWSGSVYFAGIGRHRNVMNQGKSFLTCPTSGTINVTGQIDTSVAPDANGIPLTAGQSLWCGIPPGYSNIDFKEFLFIVDGNSTTNEYQLPEWAVLIAARAPVGDEIRLGNGKAVSQWLSLTLTNNWGPMGSQVQGFKYRRTPEGDLWINAGIFAPNPFVSQQVGVLPVEYRPPTQQSIIASRDNGVTSLLRVSSNGAVQLTNSTPGVDWWINGVISMNI